MAPVATATAKTLGNTLGNILGDTLAIPVRPALLLFVICILTNTHAALQNRSPLWHALAGR